MVNSKQKGKRGELELSKKLNEYGYSTRRSQQYSGLGESSADVIGIKGLHIECKRTEVGHGKTYDWIDQAIRDSKNNSIPAVFHRANQKDWLVTLSLDDFMSLWKSFEKEFTSKD